MFGRFEKLIDPYPRDVMAAPPRSMAVFLGWFIRRTWPLLVSISLLGATLAVAEVSVFWFMGTLIDWLTHSRPQTFFAQHGVTLAWIAAVYVLVLPAVQFGWQLCFNQALFGNFPMLARWRMHTYLLRQSLAFFQNDMAGRLAQTVMQTALATRESVTKIIDILVYVAVYFVSAVLLVAKSDARLALPLVGWLGAYALIAWYFVPKLKAVSQAQAEARAVMTGRVVDSYTNILSVKLFSHTDGEVAYAQGAMRDFMVTVHRQNRLSTRLSMSLFAMNYGLLIAMAGLCIEQWRAGHVTPGAVAVSIALVQRLQGMSQWILWEVSAFFEAVGTVADGVETLGRPLTVTDPPDSKPLAVTKGEIRFDHVAFHYGRAGGVLEDLSLVIPPQQRLGLVGPSGAGKSTITSLLLRLFDVEGGVIRIDGQDIAQAAQETLRAQIGVVTQDTSLLHRSIAENIRYGRPGASFEDVVTAARSAHAHEFIMRLQDAKGRAGYDAHVGERGVNLSGGHPTILIEDRGAGTALIQELRRESVTVTAYEPKGEKQFRMEGQTALIENGFVWLPREAHWLDDFQHELIMFPKGRHDDQVDSMSQALDFLRNRNSADEWIEWARREALRAHGIEGEPHLRVRHTGGSRLYTITGRMPRLEPGGYYLLTREEWLPLRGVPGWSCENESE